MEEDMVILCQMVLQHTNNYYINVLNEEFEDTGLRLWPAMSPDLNPCDYYL
jgi:hypothetical protein